MSRKEEILFLLRWLVFALVLVAIMYFTTGCVGIVAVPKAPYPYSYHQDNKTCDYWIYHKFYSTREER